jgi:hypothetical protein
MNDNAEDLLDEDLNVELTKPLSGRIKHSIDNTYDFKKYNDKKGKVITGTRFKIAACENLCVIDFDFKKELTDSEKQTIRDDIVEKLDKSVIGLVETAHGGLHIYCNLGTTKFNTNSNVKIISTDDYDVDIFCSGNKDERYIVLPESKVKDKEHSKILKYKNIGTSFDKLFYLTTCSEVF